MMIKIAALAGALMLVPAFAAPALSDCIMCDSPEARREVEIIRRQDARGEVDHRIKMQKKCDALSVKRGAICI